MNNLDFQETELDVPLRFRSFYGKPIDQMPFLLSGMNEKGEVVDIKRVPITIKEVLQERVHGENEHDKVLFRDNYVTTSVAIIVDPDKSGEAIVGLYSDHLVRDLVHSLNSKSALQSGSLPITTDQYQAIKENTRFVFSPDVANALRSNAYNELKSREGFWDYVTEDDTNLVRDNLALVNAAVGGDMSDRIGLYISGSPGLRFVWLGSVGNYSDADSGYNLSTYGRLVGKAAEPLGRENLESKVGKNVVSSLHAGKAFEYNGTIYAPVHDVSLKNQ